MRGSMRALFSSGQKVSGGSLTADAGQAGSSLGGGRASRIPQAAGGGPLADAIAVGLMLGAVALVIVAYRKAPHSQLSSYDLIYWAGMVLGYLTVAWRAVSGRHPVLWLALLGLFTVLPKFWMSAAGPIYFDESAHFALLRSVVSSGRLFQFSPLLPIGALYPGMESAAAAIHWLTGLSTWDSALTLVAVAHCLLPVQVYYIARAFRVPHRWAVLAGLVYAVNPSFVYEDVQFAYESVAIVLMLTILRLYAEALTARGSDERRWTSVTPTLFLIAVMSFGCVVTHHLTSLTGVGLLLVAALVIRPMAGFADRNGGARRLAIRWVPVLTLAGCFALWVGFVAPQTIPYLFPHISKPVSGVFDVITGQKGSGVFRTLFSASTAPLYERVMAIVAPVLISLALLIAAIQWLRRWRRLGWNYLWALALSAFYLVSLPLTLIAEGAAGVHRTWASTFVGVSLLPAALVVLYELYKRPRWLKRTTAGVFIAALVVLLMGNTTAGTPVDYRFPGPYKFGSDTLSITPETLRLTNFVRTHLGPGTRVVADRFTALALTDRADAYTPLQVKGLPIAAIWYNRRPPVPALMYALQRHRDDYLAVDIRDGQHTPKEAPLFVRGEPRLVPPKNFVRMSHWPWLKLLYSSAHYRLYEIDYGLYYLWYPFHANQQ